MAEYKLLLPAMGEGVLEATLISWLKNEGDTIEEDDSVIEIATDKVDSDVPSPVSGTLVKKLFQENEVIKIGEPFALLETEQEVTIPVEEESEEDLPEPDLEIMAEVEKPLQNSQVNFAESSGFLSPLVKTVIETEGLSIEEVNAIHGSGKEGRVTKDDILNYVNNKDKASTAIKEDSSPKVEVPKKQTEAQASQSMSKPYVAPSTSSDNVEIIEMDRMRKLIAEHMVNSKRISPHVTSFIETDVTPVVKWRNAHKNDFLKREGEKLTFMPIFIWAVAKAIKDYPMINVSVDGDTIIRKKDINIGMATALPNGNLIVPVIKNADQYNIAGLAKYINDLANRARNNQLKPAEIQGGTYTVTNIGSFGNIMGTPIINQPQVAILAIGAIEKKPAVIETNEGDLIGIRQKMFMSHAYDHRVVDGALGGMFLQRVHEYLENFDQDMKL